MTEIDLLDGLADEVKIALKDFRLRSAKKNLIPINVYVQETPFKEGRNDEKLYPYVCVCMDDEEIGDTGEQLTVNTYFVIGVIDKEVDKQGFRDVLQIANMIYQHIFRKGIIAKAFRPKFPFSIMLSPKDIYPYFVGGIECSWEMPVFREEDKLI